MNYRLNINGQDSTLSTDARFCRAGVPVLFVRARSIEPLELIGNKTAADHVTAWARSTGNKDHADAARAYRSSCSTPKQVSSLRIDPHHLAQFARAASAEGLTLAQWIIRACLVALRR